MKRIFTLFVFALIASTGFAQTVYFEEGFDNGLPMGWEMTDEWQIGTPAATATQYFPVPDNAEGNVAVFNDDAAGQGHTGSGSITTTAIDLTDADGTIYLLLTSFFPNTDFYGADETAVVSISSDMGTTWNEVVNLQTEDSQFNTTFYDISDYIGMSVMLRMTYDDGQNWNAGWAIDKIAISDELVGVAFRSFSISAGASSMMDQAAPGTEYTHSGFVVNRGLDPITSFDVSMTDGTETYTVSVTGLDLAQNGVVPYTMEDAVMVDGNKNWTVSIENVNGSTDPDDTNTDDDSATFNLNAVTNLAPNKGVLVEEATGTWCQFCPRGTVFLSEMSKRFKKEFVGIAVHNADPMVNAAYDSNISSMVGGYPSAIWQRSTEVDPSAIVDPSLDELTVPATAVLQIGATMDGDMLTPSMGVEYLEDMNDDMSILMVLSEDNVTGTGNGWSQINAYSGGALGVMGGWELLGNSVPSSIVDYDHVGREIFGGFDGVSGEFGGDVAAGDTDSYIFDAVNVADYNMDNSYLVAMLLDSNGDVINVRQIKVDEALANGVVSTRETFDSNIATIYPNPVYNTAFVEVSLETAEEVNIAIINSLGQEVMAFEEGKMNGTAKIQLDVADLSEGVYLVRIRAGERFFTQKITKAGN